MHLMIIPEGPLAYDGEKYLYSEGERCYIDSIAKHFDRITIMAYAFKKDGQHYNSVAQYPFESSNINFIELPLKQGFFGKIIQLSITAQWIWRHLDSCDYVYILLPGYSGAICALICSLRKKKYFVYLASGWPEGAKYLNPFKGLLGKALLPFFRGFISCLEKFSVRGSQFTITAGTQLHDKYKKYKLPVIETIPRLNWKNYKLNTRTDTCEGELIKLLFVGHLIERKGVRYLIDAVKVLQDRGFNIKAVIVGGGDKEHEIKDYVRQLNLSRIIDIKGHIPNGPALTKEYRNADIFVCPTTGGEGFPRVLYEAMSQGLPIICSDVCGIPLKLKPDTGALFVEPKNGAEIAEKIIKLIHDPILRQDMIKNGYNFMSHLIEGDDGGHQVAHYFSKHIEPIQNEAII